MKHTPRWQWHDTVIYAIWLLTLGLGIVGVYVIAHFVLKYW